MRVWSSKDARAKFGTLLDLAAKEGPQVVVRRNQRFLVMTKEDFDAWPAVRATTPTKLADQDFG